MPVSKKDFIAVAEILKEARENQRRGTPVVFIMDRLNEHFASYFEAENSMFDRARFIKACEVEN